MSIGKRVLLSFLGVILLVFAIIFLGINVYIDTYYYGNKLENMDDMIIEIEEAYQVSDTAIELKLNLEFISYRFGGEITIYDEEVTMDMLISEGYFFKKGMITDEIKHNGKSAYICDNQYSSQQGQWMMYGSELSDGTVVVLGVAIESLDNTLNVVKSFLLLVSLSAMVIGAIVSAFLARSMTMPITKLNKIANEMGKLNFKVKYSGKRKDEIGELGYTLNELTNQLEETIGTLKHELDKEKQLDVLRKRFVGQVSHELQTPVSVINGYVEALSDGVVDDEEERMEYYGIIEEEAAKMSKMIKELLDLSQLEAGTFHMNKEVFDINILLDNIDHTHKFIAQKEQMNWRYKTSDKGFMVLGDEGRLEQAIRNIIHNAFKHTKETGEIAIESALINSGHKLRIRITNEGDHIPSDQLKHIWESFYKAKTSDKKQGTGLGLAIAANIFKRHDMTYKAYNVENGVCFELVIGQFLQDS